MQTKKLFVGDGPGRSIVLSKKKMLMCSAVLDWGVDF